MQAEMAIKDRAKAIEDEINSLYNMIKTESASFCTIANDTLRNICKKNINEDSARLREAIWIARIAGFVVKHHVGEKYSVTVGCTSTR